ncbi:MAG: hypothetical protein FWD87_00600 [Spirochaetaceae bacterium]|nr:hypothetical protein [Spirochaetaceae bacterium]
MYRVFCKIFYIALLGLLAIILSSCGSRIFAGIFYPKIVYGFSPIGEQPPCSANARLNAGNEFPQTFTFNIRRSGPNTFEYFFLPTIFVRNPYEVLHIREMRYEWEGNTGTFIKDKSFQLSVDRYVTNGEWYWLGVGMGGFAPRDINFEKFFKGKEVGDKFLFRIIITYSFDDGSENTQILEYNVTAVRGEFSFPRSFV